MILEQAVITIKPGTGQAFEAAFAKARILPKAIPGFVRLEMHKGHENPERYLLLAWWTDLDAHIKLFRGSPQFAEWRALLGPFFDGLPDVQHFHDPLPET